MNSTSLDFLTAADLDILYGALSTYTDPDVPRLNDLVRQVEAAQNELELSEDPVPLDDSTDDMFDNDDGLLA